MGVEVSLAVDLSGCSKRAGFKVLQMLAIPMCLWGRGYQVWDAQLLILRKGEACFTCAMDGVRRGAIVTRIGSQL